MRHRVRAVGLLLAAFVLGLAAPSASAAFHPDDVELARAIQAGDEFWRNDPQNHCLGHNGGMLDTTFPARHASAAAYTVNGVCGTIHLLLSRVEQYTRSEFCVLVVHEYGHTINHDHVSDPADIMYPAPVSAGFHTSVCDYPDPHGSTAPKEHKPPPEPKPKKTSRAEPAKPLPLPASFELLPWSAVLSDRR